MFGYPTTTVSESVSRAKQQITFIVVATQTLLFDGNRFQLLVYASYAMIASGCALLIKQTGFILRVTYILLGIGASYAFSGPLFALVIHLDAVHLGAQTDKGFGALGVALVLEQTDFLSIGRAIVGMVLGIIGRVVQLGMRAHVHIYV